MKHRLFSLLNGMEMNKTEHEWLERRFDNMTAKEELLFRGAMLLERPMTMEETIRILQGLDHYQLFYGADCDAKLGAFVMEHIHIPRPEARDYLSPETVGAAYRAGSAGCFIGGHYVARIAPDRPLPECVPTVDLPAAGDYAIRIRLVSRDDREGVWVGFPDDGEYTDSELPDELLLTLDALHAETIEQCIAVDVDCCLPQITDILSQYDSAGDLIRHAIDFGYVWAERGQGEPRWLEKWQAAMELEDCHRLGLALDLAQNLHNYEFIPRGADRRVLGLELAIRNGVLGKDDLLRRCFDSQAYIQDCMDRFDFHEVGNGCIARSGPALVYEYDHKKKPFALTL